MESVLYVPEFVNPERMVKAIYHDGEESTVRYCDLDKRYEWEDCTAIGDKMETFVAGLEVRNLLENDDFKSWKEGILW